MRLLVSVRSAEEVKAALAGGADIIDAKEPARGSLGAVTTAVLAAIAARTPTSVPLSVALGDCTELDTLRDALGAACIGERSAPVYLKLGFAGVRSLERVTALLQAATASAGGAGIVAVGYADSRLADSPPPEEVLDAAVAARVTGFLVDTWRKDGRRLLDHLAIERLAALSRRARLAGLLFALAGSLDADAIDRLAGLADVLGVRGAACRNGRSGAVDERRVARLRQRIGQEPDPLPT
jgi:(5-formylfuran-3-yl)methyl phosphate synthase